MKLIALTAVVALAVPAAAQESTHTKDSLDTVKKMLTEKKVVLLDVREKDEWDAGHLKDAVSLPLSKLKEGADAKELAKVLPKDRVIYAHCASGRRCLTAADVLKKQGYDVRPLKAGYKDLVEAGFPRAEK